MQSSRALASSNSKSRHIEALRERHAAIKKKLHEEQKHPATAIEIIKRLKLEKLKLKDEIEQEVRSSA